MLSTLLSQRWLVCCALLISLLLMNKLYAAQSIAISRYQMIALTAKHEQIHLLQQEMQIQFPANLVSIEQAIRFSLQFSGYHLVQSQQLSKPAQALLALPLPEINRKVGPITLQQLLELLAGPAFTLKIDPVHRLISFELKHQYQSFYH